MSGENPASKPTPVQDVQGDGRWMSLHHRFVADSKDKEPEVVFIGDSLVQLMHQCEIWRELFSPLHALNFGIGGDGTQHVLWRLENGELEHIRPKVSRASVGSYTSLGLCPHHCSMPFSPQIVVVWVGTNNHGHTAEQVAGGIKAIVQLVNQRQPQARVVVLVRVWESGKGRMAVFRDPLRCNHSWHGSGQLGTEQWLSSKISH
ncbi:platelet activating factor acetylhydrolase 1b catalytic subunit 3 [Phyllostomus discolor]|uniref:Platelet-activating factor acetylhydrolase IB subunit alpha1 n=1 Tax=Phyllostomus discolor TaxID=89673 RepID=A0A833YND1_9CHIR|nr:platelet activating factor acetylhydrolase 1b catalytic subunit 3 [Phyllostomus discolor]